jgi:hypothetical protein
MSIAGKELCDCGKIATWCYMPGYGDGSNSNSCDDCVPRECDCNHNYVDVNAYHPSLNDPYLPEGEEGKDWKWIEVGEVWCYIDTEGREYPCCEYMHSEDGWEKEE